ncbi:MULTISPECIES: NUDIX hydrolase [unclassified Coleofasciculus]|uniref:NUDIX hydrolase n=1 Tax=unclassified Coleofasciculus TaxID=2692782 RepID=UPI001882DFD2|nr:MULTISPECIES: NUDIX hydrolase [unclassified Coleofasciculus]MBE9128621.1 NUDIX hydrolase [Coleofasciculus sp. LEGE 07081]MBE9151451.1 NUDIX hydrolase [Coleofasciculus sp. LEGE 07092]
MDTQPVEVAIAILYRSGGFLMQLRDDVPGIIYPGCWGFFGGHIDPGETPEEGVRRELQEEIGYDPPRLEKFDCYRDSNVIRHIFHAPLTVELEQLVLAEGWDMGLVMPEQIKAGSCYSQKAGHVRPLGSPHQRILLDFLERGEYRKEERWLDDYPS